MTNKDMIRDLKLVDEIIKIYVSNKEDKHFARSVLGCMIGKLEQQPQQGCDISECQWFTCEDCTLYTEICGNMEKNKLCGVFERGQCLECYKRQGWIQVSERMPEEHGYYDVTYRCNRTGERRTTTCIWQQRKRAFSTTWGVVLAWRHRPKPYRPKEES